MPLVLKEDADTEGLPTITLAGESYFVPRLRLRERIVISGLAPKVKAIADRVKAIAAEGGERLHLSEEEYDVLIEVVRLGLVKLYPSVTSEDLLDEPIDFEELFAAYPVIILQGSSRRAGAGEGTATSQTPSSGEGSSPT